MATDAFDTEHVRLDSPAEDWEDVTLGTNLTFLPRALTCTTEGNVVLVSRTGAKSTVTLVPGAVLPCRPIRVEDPGSSSVAGVVALR